MTSRMPAAEGVVRIPIPAREARAIELAAGSVLRILDPQGRQTGDFAAYLRDDPDEYFSPSHTLSGNSKLVPGVGDSLWSNRRRPLMRILGDDVGVHDLTLGCCDPERYRVLGEPGHPSCFEAIEAALEEHGSTWGLRGELCWNVFMNVKLEEGRIVIAEAGHGAGSAIELEALENLVVALSACPQDLTPCNAYHPTPLEMRVVRRS